MKMIKINFSIILLFYARNASGVIDDLYDAGKDLRKLFSMIDDMRVNAAYDVTGVLIHDSITYKAVKDQIDRIHLKLEQMEEFMNPKIIHNSFKSWPFNIMLYKAVDTLEIYIQSIDDNYKKFYDYTKKDSSHSQLVEDSRSMILTIEEKIGMIRRQILETDGILANGENLIVTITSLANVRRAQLCGGPEILSRVLIELFRMVIIAEIKAHVMVAAAQVNLDSVDPIGWIDTLDWSQFEKQFEIYVNLFSLNVQMIDVVPLRACEPDGGDWIRNENFYELEGTFQTTIFRNHWAQCKFDSCNDAWFNKADKCDSHYYDERTGCSGTPAECVALNSVQACVLKSGPYKFQYVNSSALGFLGRTNKCPKDDGRILEDGMGWTFVFSTCACNCYRDHNKISLSMVESKVESNRVIIGLRFARKDNILFLQAKTGRLTANGYINRFSQWWQALPKDIKKIQTHAVNKKNRVIFLDDVHLPPGFVLTGVKFNKVIRGSVIGFAIEVFGVPFDYRSGRLNGDAKYRVSKQSSDVLPGQRVPFKAISPLYSTLPLLPNPPSKKYVELQRSDLFNDFGQSTLPFFDAVPIAMQSPSPLGGIGIFHKSVIDSAGFISLRVYGITYAKYFMDFETGYMENGKVSFNHSQHN